MPGSTDQPGVRRPVLTGLQDRLAWVCGRARYSFDLPENAGEPDQNSMAGLTQNSRQTHARNGVLVEQRGIEPLTSSLCANDALSQLSYCPKEPTKKSRISAEMSSKLGI
jgi:hypothetical protein